MFVKELILTNNVNFNDPIIRVAPNVIVYRPIYIFDDASTDRNSGQFKTT